MSTVNDNYDNMSDADFERMIIEFLQPNPFELITTVIFAILFIVGVSGNSLVVFVVIRNRCMRSATHIFLVNLAIADLLVLILCLPSTVLWEVTKTWWFGTVLCKVTMFCQYLSVYVSILTLVCIAIERWYAICDPIHSYNRISYRWTRNTIIIVWTIAGCLSMIEPLNVSAHPFRWSAKQNLTLTWGTQCRDDWNIDTRRYYQLAQTLALFVLPLIVITGLYGRIACVLRSKVDDRSSGAVGVIDDRKRRFSAFDQSTAAAGAQCQRRKAAKMLIAIVVVFTVCYLPVHLYNILRVFQLIPHQSDPYIVAAQKFLIRFLSYSVNCLNPVIYNFMSEKFRREFSRACGYCCVDTTNDGAGRKMIRSSPNNNNNGAINKEKTKMVRSTRKTES